MTPGEAYAARAAVSAWANALTTRFVRRVLPTDGFQIEVVQHRQTHELLLRATIFGGAEYVGTEEQLRRAIREQLRRWGRRGRAQPARSTSR